MRWWLTNYLQHLMAAVFFHICRIAQKFAAFAHSFNYSPWKFGRPREYEDHNLLRRARGTVTTRSR